MADEFNDSLPAAKAALDQMMTLFRDIYISGIVEIEKTILEKGGSVDLAREFALEFGRRILNASNFG